MKAFRTETPKPFQKVTIELETQEEVDGMLALLAHSTISNCIGLYDQYRELKPFSSPAYSQMIDDIEKAIKAKKITHHPAND